MKKFWQKPLFTLFLTTFLWTGCINTPPTPLPTQPTQSPTTTPQPQQTPTSTIDWFPATATPSPTIAPTPTPIFDLKGTVLLEDSFDQPENWNLAIAAEASSTIENNKLTLSVNQPSLITTLRNQPILDNFRIDVEVGAKICGQDARYGIVFRTTDPFNQYRLVIHCDKTLEIERILNGGTSHVTDLVYNPLVPTNLSEKAQISIIADGNTIEIYVNHLKMLTLIDKYLYAGSIGFFAEASGSQPMTASFSNLIVYQIK